MQYILGKPLGFGFVVDGSMRLTHMCQNPIFALGEIS